MNTATLVLRIAISRMKVKIKVIEVLVALMSCGLASCARQSDYRNLNTKIAANSDKSVELAHFERIHGTKYFMATINEALAGAGGSFSSARKSDNTRNVLFLDGESLTSHRLFDTYSFLILSKTEYPNPTKESEPAKANDVATRWLVFQLVKADTNGDGRLDVLDQHTIGVTDASGAEYSEVLSGIDQEFGMAMMTTGQLIIVYSSEGKKLSAVIDLDKRSISRTKALADIGPKVK